MEHFGRFYLDKEKDLTVDLFREGEEISYVLRTPNHGTANLILGVVLIPPLLRVLRSLHATDRR